MSLKNDFEVVGLEYSLDNLSRIKSENFKLYSTGKNALEKIFKENEIYAVIHAATLYRRRDEPLIDLLNTNILLPIHLLELANKFKVEVFMNTDSFFNNASYTYSYLSDYTLSKKHVLEWIKLIRNTSTTKIVNMKIFHMFGNNDAPNKFFPFVLQKIKSNEKSIDLTAGEQTRDFIYIKDVVSAFICVLSSSNVLDRYQEFEVGTAKSTSIKSLVLLMKEITNSDSKLNLGQLPYREGEIMKSKSDNSALLNLGWKPNYSLKEGLIDYINLDT
jgi:nucleoside-diphosphate-sugar epimerase